MSDIAPADPRNTTSYRLLKAVVIVLGALIVIGLGALVVGIGLKFSGHGPARAGGEAAVYTLPAGARIVEMQSEPNRLIVRVRTSSGEEIDIVDTDSGRLVARLKTAN